MPTQAQAAMPQFGGYILRPKAIVLLQQWRYRSDFLRLPSNPSVEPRSIREAISKRSGIATKRHKKAPEFSVFGGLCPPSGHFLQLPLESRGFRLRAWCLLATPLACASGVYRSRISVFGFRPSRRTLVITARLNYRLHLLDDRIRINPVLGQQVFGFPRARQLKNRQLMDLNPCGAQLARDGIT